jgi:chromosome segregation protein
MTTNALPPRANGGRARLRALDLQGYKTFASKAVFEFAPTITAIVGPNGSGKSNIADSIRWVLGEQSYSLLRGKKTEDMIFAGSEQRARAGMASATITFDNNDGWLPIDFAEVTVSRRAYRSGENEYLLNGQRVRLRDVAELLARCGLGERTYTIIGQGLVDAALSLKAEERRRLFEEAAGIGLYRSRREESLRRLDQTKRNLDRVRDILAELRPRLRSLERQAKRAQEFDQVRLDLNAALRQWYGHHWYRMLDVVGQARAQAESESAARERLHALESQTAADLNANRARIDALRQEVRRLSQQVTDVYREREAIGRDLAVTQERQRWITEQAASLEAERVARAGADAALEGRLAAARDETAARDLALAQAENELRGMRGETPLADSDSADLAPGQARLRLDRLRAELGASEARLGQGRAALEKTRLDLESVHQRLERVRTEWTAQRARRTEMEARLAEAAASLANRKELQSSAQENLKTVGEAVAQQSAALAEARAGVAVGEARLRQADDTPGVDVEAVLRKAVDRGDLKAWHGRLSSALNPSPDVALAIHAALGIFAEGFGFDSVQAVDHAADHLGESREATAAIIALSGLHPSPRPEAPVGEGIVGNAADLARPSDRYRAAVETLLGKTWVVQDRRAARRLLSSLPEGGCLVTLSGDVFRADGHVVLNAARPFRGRKEIAERLTGDLDALRKQLEQGEAELRRLNHRLDNARTEVNLADDLVSRSIMEEQRLRAEVSEALAQEKVLEGEVAFADERRQALEAQAKESEETTAAEEETRARLVEEQARLERVIRLDEVTQGGEAAAAHLAHAESTFQMAASARTEAGDRLAELEATWEAARGEAEQRAARLAALEAERARLAERVADGERRAAEVEARLTGLQALASPAEEGLRAAEEERSALERMESEHRADVQQAERRHSQAQIELARRQEEQASLRRRVEDDFGLVAFDFDETSESQVPIPFEGLVEHMPRVEELPLDFESQVSRLRLQLRRMGAINPEAQKEYLEVKERVEFLTAQVEDLEQAESQLQGVIAELDVQMETEFQKTFEAVAREFREAFTRLFGGGSVRLSLTDPDDLSQTGIDIEARLPGRREQGLAMLSGGERSLTACALVFALLKVSPTPFCVLDEVDAMLDESNVARFREMLRELSGQTQFVVITHNRQTVQAAEVLYGVSMGPDSASRVISLKLDEAARELSEAETA